LSWAEARMLHDANLKSGMPRTQEYDLVHTDFSGVNTMTEALKRMS